MLFRSGSDAHTKPQADDGWDGWGDDGTDEASAIGMISAVTIVVLTVVLNRVFRLDNVDQEG